MSLSTYHIGHIKACFKDRLNQYIELVKMLYCKLPGIGKQLPIFPLKVESKIQGERQVTNRTMCI